MLRGAILCVLFLGRCNSDLADCFPLYSRQRFYRHTIGRLINTAGSKQLFDREDLQISYLYVVFEP
jgi:hypothetical protein